MQNNMRAFNQWASRPEDERFESLPALHAAMEDLTGRSKEVSARVSDLRVEAVGGDLAVVGRKGVPARLGHWAFGQFAQRVGAGDAANYLRRIPATLAAQNLNHGLAKLQRAATGEQATEKLLITRTGGGGGMEAPELLIRAATSEKYGRIWNSDVTRRLLQLPDYWRVPPARPYRQGQRGTRPATEADVLAGAQNGLSIRVGDPIAPAGLYASSDGDMFVILVDTTHPIEVPGNPAPLFRAMIIENPEARYRNWSATFFLFEAICGNHILWGVKEMKQFTLRHIGDVSDRALLDLERRMHTIGNAATGELTEGIRSLQLKQIADTRDKVIDAVYTVSKTKSLQLTRKAIEGSYTAAEEAADVEGSPRSVWGMAQGITRYSQQSPHMDERTQLDRAAGKLLALADLF
jgi:hypothetical protein